MNYYSLEINGKAYSFDACIFDFDGVITDTEKYHYLAWCKAFRSVGVELSPQDYAPLKSTGKPNIIAFAEKKQGQQFTDVQKENIARIKDETFKQAIAGISHEDMIPGAQKFLERLKSNFVKTGVGSSAKSTAKIIGTLGLTDLFGAVVDGSAALPKKPAPDIFNAVAATLNTHPAECLVFEDAPSGIQAALNAGMTVIAVGGIKDDRALLCIDDFTALL